MKPEQANVEKRTHGTPSAIVVGAGLGGCLVASELAHRFDVTIVEWGSTKVTADNPFPVEVIDQARPSITTPVIGSGLGGTTQFWHNGLIRIPKETFKNWPFEDSELTPFLERAHHLLGGPGLESIDNDAASMREAYARAGVPPHLFGEPLFYPYQRANAWECLKLKQRVRVVTGQAIRVVLSEDNRALGVTVCHADGHSEDVLADVVVLAAGGLGTPTILQRSVKSNGQQLSDMAGFFYEDHPYAFVANFRAKAVFSKLWNFPARGGALRLPLVTMAGSHPVAFYIRPKITSGGRQVVKSALNELRNRPFSLSTYRQAFHSVDDLVDILSLKFRINVPTTRFSLLMVANQPPATGRAIWQEDERAPIQRQWELPKPYLHDLDNALAALLQQLSPVTSQVSIYANWAERLQSSLHHSGTARLALSSQAGVCSPAGNVFGVPNLFVADGSLIPDSGYSNTGLTIGALALRAASQILQMQT